MKDTTTFAHDGTKVVGYTSDYTVELLPNGYARVDQHRAGWVSLVEPRTGRFRTRPVRLPEGLVAEIQRRWGGAR